MVYLRSSGTGSFLVVYTLCLQDAEACFDSSGTFDCANLWYFWFVLFWACIVVFVIIVCIVNRCNKKKARVGFLPAVRTLASCQNDSSPPHSSTS